MPLRLATSSPQVQLVQPAATGPSKGSAPTCVTYHAGAWELSLYKCTAGTVMHHVLLSARGVMTDMQALLAAGGGRARVLPWGRLTYVGWKGHGLGGLFGGLFFWTFTSTTRWLCKPALHQLILKPPLHALQMQACNSARTCAWSWSSLGRYRARGSRALPQRSSWYPTWLPMPSVGWLRSPGPAPAPAPALHQPRPKNAHSNRRKRSSCRLGGRPQAVDHPLFMLRGAGLEGRGQRSLGRVLRQPLDKQQLQVHRSMQLRGRMRMGGSFWSSRPTSCLPMSTMRTNRCGGG